MGHLRVHVTVTVEQGAVAGDGGRPLAGCQALFGAPGKLVQQAAQAQTQAQVA
jgi:hypothetical protein